MGAEREEEERLAAAREISTEALGLPAEELKRFLDQRCGDDQVLQALVRDLMSGQLASATENHEPAADEERSEGSSPRLLSNVQFPMTIGGFRLLGRLGKGGMGEVYAAEEVETGRPVALKVLTEQRFSSTDARQRFLREARVAASISNPHCVFLYGVHEIDGEPALSMERMSGETLADHVNIADPPGVRQAVDWCCEILEGLEEAWQSGVIHRDVKPENCFVGADGAIKVGDFGLSRSLDPDSRLTRTGAFVGSPVYSAPEQIKGQVVDIRADLYSVGATLFTLLTGEPPHHGRNIGEVLARALSESPRNVRSLRADVPRGLARVIKKALRINPRRRFRTHASMLEALRPFGSVPMPMASRVGRAIAFVIDLYAFLVLAALITLGASQFGLGAVAPGWVLPIWVVLLFAISEGLLGFSPAKALFGFRVQDTRYGSASLRGALIRIVMLLLLFTAPSFLLAVLYHLGLAGDGGDPPQELVFLGIPLGVILIISTMRARNGGRGLHEILSRTRTVDVRKRGRSKPAPDRTLDLIDSTHPLAGSTVGDFLILGGLAGDPKHELLLASDERLGRRVWLRRQPSDRGSGVATAARAPFVVHWLAAVQQGTETFDVYEAPPGEPLADRVRRTGALPWREAGPVVAQIGEIFSVLEEATTATQFWLSPRGQLRWFPFPLGGSREDAREPIELERALLREVLLGDECGARELPQDLPLQVEPAVRGILQPDVKPHEIRDHARNIAGAATQPLEVPRSPLKALLTSYLVPVAWMIGLLFAFLLVRAEVMTETMTARLTWDLLATESGTPAVAGAERHDEAAHMLLLAHYGRRVKAPELERALSEEVESQQSPTRTRHEIRKLHALAKDRFGTVSGDQVNRALEHLRNDCAGERGIELLRAIEEPQRQAVHQFVEKKILGDKDYSDQWEAWKLAVLGRRFNLSCVADWMLLLSVLSGMVSLLLRGAVSHHILGLVARARRTGRRASRLRCAVRALIPMLPAAVVLMAISDLEQQGARTALGLAVIAAWAVGVVANYASSMITPGISLLDRIAGTRLVRR